MDDGACGDAAQDPLELEQVADRGHGLGVGDEHLPVEHPETSRIGGT